MLLNISLFEFRWILVVLGFLLQGMAIVLYFIITFRLRQGEYFLRLFRKKADRLFRLMFMSFLGGFVVLAVFAGLDRDILLFVGESFFCLTVYFMYKTDKTVMRYKNYCYCGYTPKPEDYLPDLYREFSEYFADVYKPVGWFFSKYNYHDLNTGRKFKTEKEAMGIAFEEFISNRYAKYDPEERLYRFIEGE